MLNRIYWGSLCMFGSLSLSACFVTVPEGAALSCVPGEVCPDELECNAVVSLCLPPGEVAAELVASEGLEASRALHATEHFAVEFSFDKTMRNAEVVFTPRNDPSDVLARYGAGGNEVSVIDNDVNVDFLPRETLAEGDYRAELRVIDDVGYPVNFSFDVVIDRQEPKPVVSQIVISDDEGTPLGAAKPNVNVVMTVNVDEALGAAAELTAQVGAAAMNFLQVGDVPLRFSARVPNAETNGSVFVEGLFCDVAGNCFDGVLPKAQESVDSPEEDFRFEVFSTPGRLELGAHRAVRTAVGQTVLVSDSVDFEGALDFTKPNVAICELGFEECVPRDVREWVFFADAAGSDELARMSVNANALRLAGDFVKLFVAGVDAAGLQTEPIVVEDYAVVRKIRPTFHSDLGRSERPGLFVQVPRPVDDSPGEPRPSALFATDNQRGLITHDVNNTPPEEGACVNLVEDLSRGVLVSIGQRLEVKEYDGVSWKTITPETGTLSPQPCAQAYYDSSVGEVVVVGNSGARLRFRFWNGKRWREEIYDHPSDVTAAVYDPVEQRTFLCFRGDAELRSFDRSLPLGDRLSIEGANVCGARSESFVYDAGSARTLLFSLTTLPQNLKVVELKEGAVTTLLESQQPLNARTIQAKYNAGQDRIEMMVERGNQGTLLSTFPAGQSLVLAGDTSGQRLGTFGNEIFIHGGERGGEPLSAHRVIDAGYGVLLTHESAAFGRRQMGTFEFGAQGEGFLFGGEGSEGLSKQALLSYRRGTWDSSDLAAPFAVSDASSAYLEEEDALVFFGGLLPGLSDRTLRYGPVSDPESAAWTLHQPALLSPPATARAVMDTLDESAILITGIREDGLRPGITSDLWRYRARSWEGPVAVLGDALAGRASAAFATSPIHCESDPEKGDVRGFIFSGVREGAPEQLRAVGDACILYERTGTLRWECLALAEHGIAARAGAEMIFDAGAQRFVIAGGRTIEGNNIESNTRNATSLVEFDACTKTFHQGGEAPPILVGHSMAYNPRSGRTVLVGGSVGPAERESNSLISKVTRVDTGQTPISVVNERLPYNSLARPGASASLDLSEVLIGDGDSLEPVNAQIQSFSIDFESCRSSMEDAALQEGQVQVWIEGPAAAESEAGLGTFIGNERTLELDALTQPLAFSGALSAQRISARCVPSDRSTEGVSVELQSGDARFILHYTLAP